MNADNLIAYFEQVDPVMAKLLRRYELPPRKRATKNKFEYLALTILYQQLSTKAAATIAARFRALFPTKDFPTPEELLRVPKETLRGTGVSGQKITYLKDLADKVASKHIDLETLEQLSDEEVIAELTKVKGIGRWTAEMFLMSALERPDIFSFGDLGLRTAIQKAYGYKVLPSVRTMQRLSKKWSPHRTHAARVLWASLDNE